MVSQVVHFIRHGHGFHNPPLFCDHQDARLTALGWKQTFEVRRHILKLKAPFVVEVSWYLRHKRRHVQCVACGNFATVKMFGDGVWHLWV